MTTWPRARRALVMTAPKSAWLHDYMTNARKPLRYKAFPPA